MAIDNQLTRDKEETVETPKTLLTSLEEEEDPLLAVIEDYVESESYELPGFKYEGLGFFQDPFEPDIGPSDPRNHTKIEELRLLRTRIFKLLREKESVIVVGPTGIGKTLQAKLMQAALEKKFEQDQLHSDQIDQTKLKNTDIPKYIDAESVTHLPTTRNPLLIDNAGEQWEYSPLLNGAIPKNCPFDSYDEMPCCVVFLSYFEYKRLIARSPRGNIQFRGSDVDIHVEFIPELSKTTIMDILRRRIIKSQGNTGQPFTEEALQEVVNYSMNLPEVSLEMAALILKEHARSLSIQEPQTSEESDIPKITASNVQEILRGTPFIIAHALKTNASSSKVSWKTKSGEEQKVTMSKTKREILLSIAQGARNGDKPGILSFDRQSLEKELEKPKSTLTHHTQLLADANVLHIQRDGLYVSYLLNSPIFHALELNAYHDRIRSS